MNEPQHTLPFTVDLWLDAEVSDKQRLRATDLFTSTLIEHLGDATLVWPSYQAFLRILQTQGSGSAETIDVENLSDAERHLFESWRLAETAALERVFGPHRHMGEGLYEIKAHW